MTAYATIFKNVNFSYAQPQTYWPNCADKIDRSAPVRSTVAINVDGGERIENERSKRNVQRLLELSLLKDNWDECGAPRIDRKVIDNSLRIVTKLSHQPFIAPTCRGTIQIEYEKKNLDYMEYEICADKACGFLMRTDGSTQNWNVVFDPPESAFNDLVQEVDAFYGDD